MNFSVPFQPKSQWQGNGEEKRIKIETGKVHEIRYEAENQKRLDAEDHEWQRYSGCSSHRKHFKKAKKKYDHSDQNRNRQEQFHVLHLPFSGFSKMSDPQSRRGDIFLSKYEEEECTDIQDERNQEGHGGGFVVEPAKFIEYQRQAETEQDQSQEQVVDAVSEKGTECLFFERLDVKLFHFKPPSSNLYYFAI